MVGKVLGIHVHRRVNGEAALIQQLLALFGGLAECVGILDLMHNVVAEEGGVPSGLAADGHVLDMQHVAHVFRLGGVCLVLRDESAFDHQIKHDVALLLRCVRVHRGVVSRRVLSDGRDRCRLAESEVRGRFREIMFGGGLHAIHARAELRDVQVSLQNLALGILLLQLQRNEHFLELAGNGVFGSVIRADRIVVLRRLVDEHILDVLLRQRRTALRVAALDICLHECAQHALHINAGMLEEAPVLACHNRLLHVLRDMRQVHDDSVLRIERRNERRAVRRIHLGLLRQVVGVEVDVGDGERRACRFRHLVGDHRERQQETRGHESACHDA